MSRYIDESILVEKVYDGEGLPTISRSVLVNCVLPTIPTADVRENVKGEWKRASGEFVFECASDGWSTKCNAIECSVCGYRLPEHEQYTNNYCPNCGADMRGGDAE